MVIKILRMKSYRMVKTVVESIGREAYIPASVTSITTPTEHDYCLLHNNLSATSS